MGHREVGRVREIESLIQESFSFAWVSTVDVATLFVSFPVPVPASVSGCMGVSVCMGVYVGVWAYGCMCALVLNRDRKEGWGEDNALVSHVLLQHIL
jgi:hypothetical protein